MRIATQVPILNHDMAYRRRGRAAEAAAKVVRRVAEAAVSREGFDLPRRTEAKMATFRRDFGLVKLAEGPNPPPVLSERSGEPVVESPPEVAQERLNVVPAEAGEDNLLVVGPVVAVETGWTAGCRWSPSGWR
jgi:hypothetical protein